MSTPETNSEATNQEDVREGTISEGKLIIPSYLIPEDGWVEPEILKRWPDVGEPIVRHKLLEPDDVKSFNIFASHELRRAIGPKYATKSHKSEPQPPKLDLGHHSVSPVDFSPEVRAILDAWFIDFLASLTETPSENTSEIKGLPIKREPQTPDESQE